MENVEKHGLSPWETETLGFVVKGKTNREIAEELDLREVTIENHLRNIFQKLAVPNRTAAAVYAVIAEIVPIKNYRNP